MWGILLEVNVYKDQKMVAIWLTSVEQEDAALRQKLTQLYDEYKKRKYKVALFHSGTEDLYTNTRELLLYNRKRMVQLEVQREKLSGMPLILSGHSQTPSIQC